MHFKTDWRAHLLVVEPVPADSPPVVAEVILYGRVCHLHSRGDIRNSVNITILCGFKGADLRVAKRENDFVNTAQ